MTSALFVASFSSSSVGAESLDISNSPRGNPLSCWVGKCCKGPFAHYSRWKITGSSDDILSFHLGYFHSTVWFDPIHVDGQSTLAAIVFNNLRVLPLPHTHNLSGQIWRNGKQLGHEKNCFNPSKSLFYRKKVFLYIVKILHKNY